MVTAMKNGQVSDADVNQLARQLGVDPNDPIVLVARGNAKLEAKVEAWTQTNLKLLELLTSKTEETDRLARNSNKLTTLLSGLDTQLQGLQRQIETWNASSQSSTSSQGYEDKQDLKQLTQAVINAHAKIEQLAIVIKELQTIRENDLLWDLVTRWGFRALVVGLCFGVWSTYLKTEYVAKRAEWTMIKLERMEWLINMNK
jgi:hypothetical protein